MQHEPYAPSRTTVAVVGLGYVGLPLAVETRRRGYPVIGIDTDPRRIELLSRGEPPFRDDRLRDDLARSALSVTNDFSRIREAKIVIICVPTPVTEDHSPDLEPLRAASMSIAPFLAPQTLVIVESTVNPGVCESLTAAILESGAPPGSRETFFLAHCPERVNPGDPEWHVGNIPRVVGGRDRESLERAVLFYRSIIDAAVTPMRSLAEAEAVKMVENSFRDINIAFVNELAMSFDHLGIDVVDVINGAATKPFSFLPHYPGAGVGGHCIPVDPYYLITAAKHNGFNHRFLSLARDINNNMPRYTVDVLERAMRSRGMPLGAARVAILGLSYKADVDDCRESPSFAIIAEIKRRGGMPVAFDPYVKTRSDVSTIEEALDGARAVLIATAHERFRRLPPAFFAARGIDVIVDGRNCLPQERFRAAGLHYAGIGRSGGALKGAFAPAQITYAAAE